MILLKSPERKDYLPYEHYKESYEIFEIFAKIILYNFAIYSVNTRETIIRNFISKGIVSLKGILTLWELEAYQDCWILNRCILDRLFHLVALNEGDSFERFEKWSFVKQFESKNKVKSDNEFKDRLNPDFYKNSEKQKSYYKKIKEENIKWERPDAEKIAKVMNLDFLYKYGYDYGSSLVHPMANDGQEDFHRFLNLPEKDKYPDQIIVVNNAFLALILLIQEGLNSSNLLWASVSYDFLDHSLYNLEKKKINQLKQTLLTIKRLHIEKRLCTKK